MRTTHSLLIVLSVIALTRAAGAAPLHVSHCVLSVDSTRAAAEFTARVGRPAHGVTLDFVTAAGRTAQPTSTVTVAKGTGALLTLDSAVGAAGLGVDLEAGTGFRGVQTANVTSTDGVTFSGSVDGRDVVPFQPTSGLHALTFADGQPAPVVKVKGSVRGALKRLTKQTLRSPCLGDPLNGAGTGLLSACQRCNIACLGPQWRCGLEALAALPKCKGDPLVCVTHLETAGYGCAATAAQCAAACFGGSDCAAAAVSADPGGGG